MTSCVFLGLASLSIALARPQSGKTLTQVQASGIDIMILIDVSGSMLAEDFTIGGHRASRQETIKDVTQKFIEGRPNDRIGMIAFASRPYLVSPLTLDHDWLLQNLDRVRIGLVEDGTAIGSAIASGLNRLKDRKLEKQGADPAHRRRQQCRQNLAEHGRGSGQGAGRAFLRIGAGTNGVAPVPVFDQRTGQPLVDENGNRVLRMERVEFDETGLKKVAEIAGRQILPRGGYRIAGAASTAISTSWRNRPCSIRSTSNTTISTRGSWTAGFALLGAGVAAQPNHLEEPAMSLRRTGMVLGISRRAAARGHFPAQ